MNADSLINWIEGYLDACKNKPNPNQVKEIRKKIEEYRKPNPLSNTLFTMPPGTTSPYYGGTQLLTDTPVYQYTAGSGTPIPFAGTTISNSSSVSQENDEIHELIEKAKRATTMEELDQE